MLAEAIKSIESRDSLSAKVRHEVNLFGQHLVGSGVYLEQRPGRDNLLRLELRLQLGDKPSSVVTVCDGRYLWEHRNMPSKAELVRIDVVWAMRALERADNAAGANPPVTSPARPGMLPGLGGLPRVLRGLNEHFDFSVVEPGHWGPKKEPAWRLQGGWKRADLLQLLPKQAGKIQEGAAPDLSRLPEYAPDSVVVYIGQRDQLPYRIEYRRAAKPRGRDDESDRPLVAVDFYEFAINEPIDRTQFVYNPPSNTEFSDQTESFVQTLKK